MDQLVEHVAANIRAHQLLGGGERVLVAVSGGVDSMVLLAVLLKLSPESGWRLTVAHFNHRLRGRASDADERLVQRVAEQAGLPLVAGAGDVRAEAGSRGLSIEMAARELRHRFLARAAARRRIRTVVTAHHADDQVELFLLRLLRGASAEGLAGMRWESKSPFGQGQRLVRPLLDVPKPDLLAYAASQGVPFREDATNAGLDHLRNRIRHDLLPRLEKDYQPAIRRVLLRQAVALADDAGHIAEEARRWRLKSRRTGFPRLAVALQRRILTDELVACGLQPEFELVERLRLGRGRPVSVAADRSVGCDSGGRLHLKSPPQREFLSEQQPVALRGKSGQVLFGGLELGWRLEHCEPAGSGAERGRRPARPTECAGSECFDAGKVGGSIVLRHWRPGDRFQPIGMPQPVKLQDLFTNAKVPSAQRRERVVAVAESGAIFWVEGLRIGDRYKLDTATRRQLKWRWKRP